MTLSTLLVVAAAVLPAALWRQLRPRTPRTRKARVLLIVAALIGVQAVIGAPAAMADQCGESPNPEIPGAGMVGAVDPPTQNKGEKDSDYDKFGYAGFVWHVYDDNCVLSKSLTDPNETIDTWGGNELFNVGKNIVGATNSLHYTLMGGDLLAPLDKGIEQTTQALYSGPYTQWLWLPLLLLGVMVFRYIWNGDLAAISKRGLWALAGLGVAAAAYATPLFYTHLLDDVLIKGTSQVQAGFLPAVNVDERNQLPTMLHDQVIGRNWLRGEFGSPDAQQAKQYGPALLEAQAFTKTEAATADQAAVDAKKQQYKDISTKLGNATGYFKGTDGNRTGDGFLAMFQGIAYGLFQLLAKAAVLLGQVLMRIVVLAAPLIGFVAILYHDLLRKVGQAVGAVLLNVIVLAVLAGLHTKLLALIFDPANQLAMLVQVLLAALVTMIFLVVGRPVRRMRQMVELSVGAVGGGVPGAGPGLFSRFRRGGRAEVATPQDEFWATVRDTDPDPSEQVSGDRGGRRVRPEASTPVAATAERTDRRPGAERVERRAVAGSAYRRDDPDGVPALPSGGPRGGRPAAALPGGHTSRLVDSPPVVDRGWDRVDEPVVVPSRVMPDRMTYDEGPAATPRRADMEMVAGRPVFVLYRPSRGLEVRDDRDSPVR